jgi:hypothetical protein
MLRLDVKFGTEVIPLIPYSGFERLFGLSR